MTFADLMSLLMCFFVLLLSFSEMDVAKFKELAGSLKFAFGVQREIQTREIPKGLNIIAREFSPGKPDPTPLPQIRQHTTDDLKDYMDILPVPPLPPEPSEIDVQKLIEALKKEIEQGTISIETQEQRVIIRIQEKGSFPSGSADFVSGFEEVLSRIGEVLSRTTSGQIVIAGHTDDVPIATARFRSNWELSAARAVTVLHHLIMTHRFDPRRFLIEGHADSLPLVPNLSAEQRAQNRRVEIIIVKGTDLESEMSIDD
jgi:chemotaxis protein MotB